MSRIDKLMERRARAWDQMNALRDAVAERELSAEEREQWDRIESDLQSLGSAIENEQRDERVEQALNRPVEDRELNGAVAAPPAVGAPDEERISEIFGRYLRFGLGELSPEERKIMRGRFQTRNGQELRAQAEGTNSAGGYLVPQGYWVRISEVLKAYGGLLSLANVIHTASGQPLPWPNNDDTSNVGALLSENAQVSEVDLTVGQRMLNAYTFTSNLVLVSLELLQDSAFDLDAWIPKKLGIRLGRAVAQYLQTGTGSAQPTGLNPNVTAGANVASGSGITTGSAWIGQANVGAYDNLVDLVHSVDPAYRTSPNCRFVMNDSTLADIRKIKDSYGHPIWQPTVASSDPDMILGYPLTIDQETPSIGVSTKPITFGDHEAGFVVRQCLDVQMMRLEERYADYLQVGYFGFMRLDSHPDDPNAVKALAFPAT